MREVLILRHPACVCNIQAYDYWYEVLILHHSACVCNIQAYDYWYEVLILRHPACVCRLMTIGPTIEMKGTNGQLLGAVACAHIHGYGLSFARQLVGHLNYIVE